MLSGLFMLINEVKFVPNASEIAQQKGSFEKISSLVSRILHFTN
jgi:hypothetical protein